jgi:hypothetical protein
VVSVLWALGAGLHEFNASRQVAGSAAYFAERNCLDKPHKSLSDSEFRELCELESSRTYNQFMQGVWFMVLLVALVPILIAWILAYLGVWIVRWIRAGLRAEMP